MSPQDEAFAKMVESTAAIVRGAQQLHAALNQVTVTAATAAQAVANGFASVGAAYSAEPPIFAVGDRVWMIRNRRGGEWSFHLVTGTIMDSHATPDVGFDGEVPTCVHQAFLHTTPEAAYRGFRASLHPEVQVLLDAWWASLDPSIASDDDDAIGISE